MIDAKDPPENSTEFAEVIEEEESEDEHEEDDSWISFFKLDTDKDKSFEVEDDLIKSNISCVAGTIQMFNIILGV